MNVNGKVAVVTSGASGIGLALCTRFAKEGALVVLSDLDQEACNRHAAPIGALPLAADVGREEDIKNPVAASIGHFGRIALFVSNAGIAIDLTRWPIRLPYSARSLSDGLRCRSSPTGGLCSESWNPALPTRCIGPRSWPNSERGPTS